MQAKEMIIFYLHVFACKSFLLVRCDDIDRIVDSNFH